MSTHIVPSPVIPAARTRRAGARPLGLAWLTLAAALAATSLLGPLVTGVVDWRITDLLESQLVGLDAVSLVLVAPIAAVAGILVLRGDARGPVLGIGPAAYAAYMVPQYVLGPDYLGVEGNNERVFPLMVALLVLGVATAIRAWSSIDLGRLQASPRAERLVGRVLLPIAGIAVLMRYAGALPEIMGPDPDTADYLAGPTFVWTISLLDLGLLLPAVAAACLGYRRGAPWARRALYAVVAWLALIGVAVAGMAVAMAVRDEPSMTAGALAAMLVLAAWLAATAAVLFIPVLRR